MRLLLIIGILITAIIYGYENNQNTSSGIVFDSIELVPMVDSLLQHFISTEALNYDSVDIYLFTYKVNEERIVTFIATNYGEKYLTHYKPMIYLYRKKMRIFILTGAEEIFNIKIKREISKNHNESIWRPVSYVIINDSILIIPKGIPPFAPRPTLLIRK